MPPVSLFSQSGAGFKTEVGYGGSFGMTKSKETDIRLDTLKQLVSELAKAIGPACEVILHDLRNLDSSCVAISGNVTGRKVGAPMTDLGLRILKKSEQASNLINYSSTSSDGRPLKSSTIIIRNSINKPIAFVCMNFDLSTLFILRDVINSSFPTDLPTSEVALNTDTKETYPREVQEILKSAVAEVLKRFDKPISIMKKRDRLQVVELLDEAGIFAIKNSHYYVASLLGTSRYTIYNYLSEIRQHAKTT